MAHPLKNTLHTVTITAATPQGEGVCRLPDGLSVFVRGALAGERCIISMMKVTKRCGWARLVEVLEPSAARVEPDCPYYPKCGGCTLRHCTYEEELRLKRQRVDDAFARIGALPLRIETIHPAPHRCGYRNKVQFPVGGSLEMGVRLGYYRQHSHDVLDVAECRLQPECCGIAGRTVKAWMERYAIHPYDERSRTGLVRHLFCRVNGDGEVLVCLVINGAALPHRKELVNALRNALPTLAGVMLNCNDRDTNVILGQAYTTLWGQDHLYDTLCGITFRLSVPSFFQVNREQAEVLYRRAVDFAALTGSETVVDLYCGAGTISLVMARHAGRVIGAEIVPEAVADAWDNASRNGFHNAEFICADAKDAAAELARRGLRPDVVCVDPPRKGLAQSVITDIASMGPKRVVYVSCDPGTLARDLSLFGMEGYCASRVEAVDLFPGTGHVETVVCLSNKNAKPKDYVEIGVDAADYYRIKDSGKSSK